MQENKPKSRARGALKVRRGLQRKEAITYLEQGDTIGQIARREGMKGCRALIPEWAEESGVEVTAHTKKGIRDMDKYNRAIELIASGQSTRKVSMILKVTEQTIRNWIRLHKSKMKETSQGIKDILLEGDADKLVSSINDLIENETDPERIAKLQDMINIINSEQGKEEQGEEEPTL